MLTRQIINLFRRNMSTINNMDKNSVLVEKLGGITTIGINRPSKRNCLDFETARILEQAINHFEEDTTSTVAVLYGTGGNFCSGFDLQEIANFEESNSSTAPFSLLALKNFVSKPMVAALSGYTVAGGLELALLCDLRVMEDTAVVGLYGRRFGIPLVDGATVRLPATIGLTRALDLILTGRSLNAKEAFDWGLVNRIVACGTGLGQAIQLATCLTKYPQECIIADRSSTYNAAFNQVYDELLAYERQKASSVKLKDIIAGAKKFIGGIGRHGKTYNLTEKETCEWEKEFTQTAKSKL